MQWFKDYISGPTHQWWVENVWRPSWTKFVALVYGIPALAISGWDAFASWAGDDTINTYLTRIDVPNWVPVALASVAVIHYIAHGRSDNT